MSPSSQGRCVKPGRGAGFQHRGGLAWKEPVPRGRWDFRNQEAGSRRAAPCAFLSVSCGGLRPGSGQVALCYEQSGSGWHVWGLGCLHWCLCLHVWSGLGLEVHSYQSFMCYRICF